MIGKLLLCRPFTIIANVKEHILELLGIAMHMLAHSTKHMQLCAPHQMLFLDARHDRLGNTARRYNDSGVTAAFFCGQDVHKQ